MNHNIQNSGKHLNHILAITTCKKHRAETDKPCFTIKPGSKIDVDTLFAVCGARIKRAGFVGQISPLSLSQNAPAGRGIPRNKRPKGKPKPKP